MDKFHLYILLSRDHKHSYVGKTNNLIRRLSEHNRGDQIATKAYRPWKIVYTESFSTEEEARRREHYFKSGVGRELKNSIINNYIAG